MCIPGVIINPYAEQINAISTLKVQVKTNHGVERINNNALIGK